MLSSMLIDACAQSGDMEKAAECLAKTQEARLMPDIIPYRAIIEARAKPGDMAKAVRSLSKAQEAGLMPIITMLL